MLRNGLSYTKHVIFMRDYLAGIKTGPVKVPVAPRDPPVGITALLPKMLDSRKRPARRCQRGQHFQLFQEQGVNSLSHHHARTGVRREAVGREAVGRCASLADRGGHPRHCRRGICILAPFLFFMRAIGGLRRFIRVLEPQVLAMFESDRGD